MTIGDGAGAGGVMSSLTGQHRRPGRRVAPFAAVIVLAQVADVTVLPQLGLPGPTPDLVLVVVIGLALAHGSVRGATVGLLAGLLADLTPPAAALLGVTALSYGLAGALAGHWQRPRGTPPVLAMLALALGVVASTVVRLLLSGRSEGPTHLLEAAMVATGYALVLGAVLLPLVQGLDRRLDEELL